MLPVFLPAPARIPTKQLGQSQTESGKVGLFFSSYPSFRQELPGKFSLAYQKKIVDFLQEENRWILKQHLTEQSRIVILAKDLDFKI